MLAFQDRYGILNLNRIHSRTKDLDIEEIRKTGDINVNNFFLITFLTLLSVEDHFDSLYENFWNISLNLKNCEDSS